MKELYTQINASFCYSGEVKPQSSDTMLFFNCDRVRDKLIWLVQPMQLIIFN